MVEHERQVSLSDQLLQPGTAQVFTIAHADTPQTFSAAVKRDQLRFPEQSSAPPKFTQGTEVLLRADLAAWLVYAQCNEYSN